MISVVFPGQGSQVPGMGKELFQLRPEAQAVFRTVAAVTGIDVEALCFDTDEVTLRETQNAQIALFTVSVAAFRCLKRHLDGEVRIGAVAGHSVGEYAAVVAAGILDVGEGAQLVQTRGQLMAEAGREKPGSMAAILGLGRAELETELAKVPGIVVIANDNCPGQLVISGEAEAVHRASELASEAGAKRIIALNVSGAFHSPLMAEASEKMFESLNRMHYQERTDVGPIYANATSEAVGREADLPKFLRDGLAGPVRWTETIEHMRRDEVDVFIECGVGDVLSGLIRRIDRSATCYRVQNLTSLEETISALRQ